MARKLTAWNKLVQKQFKAGKSKDKNYSFKDALQDASKSHTSGGGSDALTSEIPLPPHSNTDPEKNVDTLSPTNGGSSLVGTPITGGMPIHKGGRRTKKNKSHKKRGKSQKKQKKSKHH